MEYSDNDESGDTCVDLNWYIWRNYGHKGKVCTKGADNGSVVYSGGIMLSGWKAISMTNTFFTNGNNKQCYNKDMSNIRIKPCVDLDWGAGEFEVCIKATIKFYIGSHTFYDDCHSVELPPDMRAAMAEMSTRAEASDGLLRGS